MKKEKIAVVSGGVKNTEKKGSLPEGSDTLIKEKKQYAIKAFTQLKLKDLSRIDFFLSEDGDILLNEINTFPGMTPISMFPKMMENNGHSMVSFLEQCIRKALKK